MDSQNPLVWFVLVLSFTAVSAILYLLFRRSKQRADDQWEVVRRLQIGDRWHSWKELVVRDGDTDPRLHAALEGMVRDGLVECEGLEIGQPIYRPTQDGWNLMKKLRWNG